MIVFQSGSLGSGTNTGFSAWGIDAAGGGTGFASPPEGNINGEPANLDFGFLFRNPPKSRPKGIAPISIALSIAIMATMELANNIDDILNKPLAEKDDDDDYITVYRVYGQDSGREGMSWTDEDPRTIEDYRNRAGLPTDGPLNTSGAHNSAEWLVIGRVKSNNVELWRDAYPLDGNQGGLSELIIYPHNVYNKRDEKFFER